MKFLIVAATMLAVGLAGLDSAAARSDRSSGGGGSSHSSGGSRSSGAYRAHAPRVHAPRAARAKSDYVIVKCKTPACFKKHPSGTYGFVPKAKKT